MTREEFDKRIEDTKRWRNGALMALDISDEYITSLETTIKSQEIIIKDKSAIMKAMAQPKSEFIDTSCMRCKNVNDCSLCENVKNETGMKLREMSFFCFEPKE